MKLAEISLLILVAVLLYGGVEGAITSGNVNTGDCVCATTTVNGRAAAGLSASIVTQVTPGSCGEIYGGILTTDGYTWFEIDYQGQRIWVAGNYFDKSSASSCSSGSSFAGCPTIVTRSQWGARAPTSISYMSLPAQYAFIHHAESGECFDQSSCASKVRGFQNYHMDDRGWSDIGYSFLIGGDGSIFEGRGWDKVGAHTGGYNSVGFGFCFIGNFMTKLPTSIQISKAKEIIECGVSQGKLRSDYIVRGHRDMGSTDCPGDELYALIKTWPHY